MPNHPKLAALPMLNQICVVFYCKVLQELPQRLLKIDQFQWKKKNELSLLLSSINWAIKIYPTSCPGLPAAINTRLPPSSSHGWGATPGACSLFALAVTGCASGILPLLWGFTVTSRNSWEKEHSNQIPPAFPQSLLKFGGLCALGRISVISLLKLIPNFCYYLLTH